MPVNKGTPIFIEDVALWNARLTSQTMDRAGTGTAVLLGTASPSGFLAFSAWAIPAGDFSANVLRFFRQKAGQSTFDLVLEASIAAVASSNNTTAIARTNLVFPEVLTPTGSFGLMLTAGDLLYAALGTSSGVALHVWVQGGHYENV
jgi:hypothetical protein